MDAVKAQTCIGFPFWYSCSDMLGFRASKRDTGIRGAKPSPAAVYRSHGLPSMMHVHGCLLTSALMYGQETCSSQTHILPTPDIASFRLPKRVVHVRYTRSRIQGTDPAVAPPCSGRSSPLRRGPGWEGGLRGQWFVGTFSARGFKIRY